MFILATMWRRIASNKDANIPARATLHEARGSPIANVPVIFRLHLSLGGDHVLGKPATMEGGSAVVKILATGSEHLKVTASFEGGN